METHLVVIPVTVIFCPNHHDSKHMSCTIFCSNHLIRIWIRTISVLKKNCCEHNCNTHCLGLCKIQNDWTTEMDVMGKQFSMTLTHWGREKMATILQTIFSNAFSLNGYAWISFHSVNFVPNSLIDNKPALVQIMAWRWSGDKPLSEPMMALFIDAYMCHVASVS